MHIFFFYCNWVVVVCLVLWLFCRMLVDGAYHEFKVVLILTYIFVASIFVYSLSGYYILRNLVPINKKYISIEGENRFLVEIEIVYEDGYFKSIKPIGEARLIKK